MPYFRLFVPALHRPQRCDNTWNSVINTQKRAAFFFFLFFLWLPEDEIRKGERETLYAVTLDQERRINHDDDGCEL